MTNSPRKILVTLTCSNKLSDEQVARFLAESVVAYRQDTKFVGTDFLEQPHGIYIGKTDSKPWIPESGKDIDWCVGMKLATQDSMRVGNGIIYDIEDRELLGKLYFVETDFGNRMKFTKEELEELFYPRPDLEMDYGVWKAEREHLQCNNKHEDIDMTDYTATKLTGNWRVQTTWFGPRIFVQEQVSYEDSHGNPDPFHVFIWRKASNKDLIDLNLQGTQYGKS